MRLDKIRLFIGITVLLGVVACLGVADHYAHAQSARNGVRIQLGQISGAGGLSGSAFLPIPPSRMQATALAGSPCAGVRLAGIATLPRGPVQAVEMTLLLTETGREGTIGLGACPGGTFAFQLENGARIAVERGEIALREVDLPAGLVAGTYRGTASSDGDPMTVTGDFRLQFRPLPRD